MISTAAAPCLCRGFPCGSEVKVYAYNEGDPGSIPGREDPLEKEMAIYSSIPAWEIPWTEEPGKIQCMGSQELDSLVTKPPPEMVGVSPEACLF